MFTALEKLIMYTAIALSMQLGKSLIRLKSFNDKGFSFCAYHPCYAIQRFCLLCTWWLIVQEYPKSPEATKT